MAKYLDRLEELRDAGKLTQEEYDELADLSAAKEAIKEFNSVKTERDSLAAKVEQFENAPKRKEALKRVGVDYDAQPQYGRDALDQIPSDKLDDLTFVANFVQEKGFEATVSTDQPNTEPSGAERITNATVALGTGAPSGTKETYEEAVIKATTPQELDEVYARFGKQPAAQS